MRVAQVLWPPHGVRACGGRLVYQCQMGFNDDRGICTNSQKHVGGGKQLPQVLFKHINQGTFKRKHTSNDCFKHLITIGQCDKK